MSPPESESSNIPFQSNLTPEEFNDFVKNKYSNEELRKNLSCIHVNTRSLNHNLDALSLFLSSLSIQTSVIGITETWLTENSPLSLCNISNYEFIGNNRKLKRGGGVGVYIRKDISFNRRTDLDVFTDFLESIFIELEQSNSSTIIGVMYRPPGQSLDDFFKTLNSILDIVRKENFLFVG